MSSRYSKWMVAKTKNLLGVSPLQDLCDRLVQRPKQVLYDKNRKDYEHRKAVKTKVFAPVPAKSPQTSITDIRWHTRQTFFVCSLVCTIIRNTLPHQRGGKKQGLGPRNDVLTTCKAIR